MKSFIKIMIVLILVLGFTQSAFSYVDLEFEITASPEEIMFQEPFLASFRLTNNGNETANGYISIIWKLIERPDCDDEIFVAEIENFYVYFYEYLDPGESVEYEDVCCMEYDNPEPGEYLLKGSYAAYDWTDTNPNNDYDCAEVIVVPDCSCDPEPVIISPMPETIYEVYAGESFDLTITAQNTSSSCHTPDNYISVSFGFFMDQNDSQYVTPTAWSGDFTFEEYVAGDQIYDRDCEEMISSYLLVDAYTDDWLAGEQHYITLNVTPPTPDEFPTDYVVKIRCTMGCWWGCTYYNSEPPPYTDQQRWEVRHVYIRVLASPEPDIDVDPDSYDYGEVPVGEFSDHEFTVSNTGNEVLNVSSQSIIGANPGDFEIISGGGSFSLNPDSTRSVTIRFEPDSIGDRSATWRINSDDPDENPLDISLYGYGEINIEPPPPPTLISPQDGTIRNDPSPEFVWNSIIGHNVNQYKIQLDTTSTFSSPINHWTIDTSWVVTPELSEGEWFWRVRAHNDAGWGSYSEHWSYTYDDTVAIIDETNINLPKFFTLSQSYPNPFNPTTTIEYALPEASHVTLDVYDILGREVEALVNEQQQAGYHSIIWNASDQTSGMYFYKIQAGDFTETKKMLLLK